MSVPTHFFKVICGKTSKNEYEILAFVLVRRVSVSCFWLLKLTEWSQPNIAIPDKTPLKNFVVPLQTLERMAGKKFVSREVGLLTFFAGYIFYERLSNKYQLPSPPLS